MTTRLFIELKEVFSCTTEIAIVFLVNATSEVAEKTFCLMKDTMKYVINKHGIDRAKYHVIIRDPEESSFQSHEICFNSNFVNVAALEDATEDISRGDVDVPALHKDLKKADEAFESNTLRCDTEKVSHKMADNYPHCCKLPYGFGRSAFFSLCFL